MATRTKTWIEFFRIEREIRTCAERAGIKPRRAAQLAQQLACRPLPRPQAARLLALASPPCTDPHIVAAHRLLTQLEPDATPPLALVRVAELPDGVFGEHRGGLITIDPTSEFYHRAESGDLLPLALLLHHEEFHRRNGGNEPRALEASVRFLERHNAPQALIDNTRAVWLAACAINTEE